MSVRTRPIDKAKTWLIHASNSSEPLHKIINMEASNRSVLLPASRMHISTVEEPAKLEHITPLSHVCRCFMACTMDCKDNAKAIPRIELIAYDKPKRENVWVGMPLSHLDSTRSITGSEISEAEYSATICPLPKESRYRLP